MPPRRLTTFVTVALVSAAAAARPLRDLGADSLRGDEEVYAEVVLDSRTEERWFGVPAQTSDSR